ncbi:hypothetical protein GLOTRDRAFT_30191 [Gloeophyllum trabeum ATCC 11539]|uniref:Uncharacterized protein n=1 Tax=Gloeophyllum trabeum (strain ATCC 11539 / FP-39264 / Madison 617) TaxID=670483 RepID=S7S5K3_GLOTA|nr:uncharacterized protein GLOTRDRAFT_30191 [Gloeophyllum trabeum ATCC 11539]EPQ61274.1 hypothetical protein GLOTRDRAFT_30191 [Gloeophyllum trabeum ATCC 11539]
MTLAYEGNDYPEHFSIPALAEAFLTVEDSVHYQIDTPESFDEWGSMFPLGGGFVHLGPKHRAFSISMFHQLHCLNNLRKGIVSEDLADAQLAHLQHCINYLRQSILCSPDLRLEPQSVFLREAYHIDGIDGLGLTHRCVDWETIYRATENNFLEWKTQSESEEDLW